MGEVLAYEGQIDHIRNKAPICSITKGVNFPTAIASDSSGNVYLDYSTFNSSEFGMPPYYVDVYAPNCGKKIAKIKDPFISGDEPRQIAFANGHFYVGNQIGQTGQQANVAVCSLKKKKCTGELTGSGSVKIGSVIGVVADASGNVYASVYEGSSSTTALVEWPKGRGTAKIVATPSVGSCYTSPGPMAVDSQGSLLEGDSYCGVLFVFTGCPTACVQAATLPFEDADSSGFVLSPDNKTLYVATELGWVDVYAYSGVKGIKYEYAINDGLSKSGVPYDVTLVQGKN